MDLSNIWEVFKSGSTGLKPFNWVYRFDISFVVQSQHASHLPMSSCPTLTTCWKPQGSEISVLDGARYLEEKTRMHVKQFKRILQWQRMNLSKILSILILHMRALAHWAIELEAILLVKLLNCFFVCLLNTFRLIAIRLICESNVSCPTFCLPSPPPCLAVSASAAVSSTSPAVRSTRCSEGRTSTSGRRSKSPGRSGLSRKRGRSEMRMRVYESLRDWWTSHNFKTKDIKKGVNTYLDWSKLN